MSGSDSGARKNALPNAIPPTALVMFAIFSVQLGAALAKSLFDQLGPGGMVFLRIAFAAVVLLVLLRPKLGGFARGDYAVAVAFGIALAAMNLSMYMALDRIPLGIAVTLEFVGPLGVAVAGSRRALDVLWVVLAGSGILLLAPLGVLGESNLDPIGVLFALMAGSFWASYILLSARTGSVFPGTTGLVISLCIGTVVLLPVGISSGGAALLDPWLLLAGFGVAMLSAAIPYSLEMQALRKIPSRVFGVLMSLEPAVAAVLGFLVLGETLGLKSITAVLLVMVAAAGASRFGSKPAG